MRIRCVVFLMMFCLPAASLSACTVFVLKKENAVMVGKNLDWPVGEGCVLVNPGDVAKSALPGGEGKHLTWRSRFGSVTFNLLGRGFPLGGMNEKGLVIEEANYTPSRYPRGPGPVVNEFQWIQYHLDTCADTAEVLASLKRLRIVPILARVHYLVCDAAGRAAVVEFIAGKVRVYTGDDLPVVVITNTSYDHSLKSLAIHQGFGGTRAVGDGPESPERFVRAATWVRGLQSLPGQLTPDRVFRILDNVAQQDTRWRIVYDPAGMVIRFHTLGKPTVRTIRIQDLDFHRPMAVADIHTVPLRFQPFTPAANRKLLGRVFDQMVRLDLVDAGEAASLLEGLLAHVERDRP
ncbi:MAG: linear amide C-N hydrolase [Candidatus Aminicenantes bacterium]|nr:linear amide C-N hydrolase [Candidatus Aminicenantes bacterium]